MEHAAIKKLRFFIQGTSYTELNLNLYPSQYNPGLF
jgi:hypothetical protein